MTDISSFLPEVMPEPDNFDPIPVGEYEAMITDSEVGPNAAGTGTNIKFCYDIIDGEFTNRKIYQYLAINNPSEKAQNIALKTLSKIRVAIGSDFTDTEQAHNVPLTVSVGIQPGNDKYGPSNTIKDVKPLSSKKENSKEEQDPWKV